LERLVCKTNPPLFLAATSLAFSTKSNVSSFPVAKPEPFKGYETGGK
jgi:hypothetical protein